MAKDEERLRTVFDNVAELYDEARPGYPEKVFRDVVSLSGIPGGGRILEIGCGTGQATLPFARRGYKISCVELGENLAAVARSNLAPYPGVEVEVGNFEEHKVPEGVFDLAVSATAFHWLDPKIAYPKVARALRPGGSVALFWNEHVHAEADPGFFVAVEKVYAREAPEIWNKSYAGPPPPEEAPDRTGEIEGSGVFGPVIRRTYRWDQPYAAAGYLRVLATYSGHRSLDEDTRSRLFGGISRLIDEEYAGRIVKGYLTTLYVARRQ